MALAHKRTKRVRATSGRAIRESAPAYLTTQQAVQRIDEMIRELQAMRRQLTQPQPIVAPNIVDELFGAAGKGTWDEYDMDFDVKRFSDWQFR